MKSDANPGPETTSLTPVAPLGFTGERFTPELRGEIRIEHFHRYAVALGLVAGRDVLDVACGEGYGAYLLASVARRVVGVDIASDAVRHAGVRYRASNLTFHISDASALDLPSGSFDVVVSFETIEHVSAQREMLAEIRRVLRSDGVLLLSSPNKTVYGEQDNGGNEFHVRELEFTELDSLIRQEFDSVAYFGQRIMMGSVVAPLQPVEAPVDSWIDDGEGPRKGSPPVEAPVYFLAICGATPTAVAGVGPSVLYPAGNDLLSKYVGYAKWAKECDRQIHATRDAYAALDAEHLRVGEWARDLDGERTALRAVLDDKERDIAELRGQLSDAQQLQQQLEFQIAANRGHFENFRGQISALQLEAARLADKHRLELVVQEKEYLDKLADAHRRETEGVLGHAVRERELTGQLQDAHGARMRTEAEWAQKLAAQEADAASRLECMANEMLTIRHELAKAHESHSAQIRTWQDRDAANADAAARRDQQWEQLLEHERAAHRAALDNEEARFLRMQEAAANERFLLLEQIRALEGEVTSVREAGIRAMREHRALEAKWQSDLALEARGSQDRIDALQVALRTQGQEWRSRLDAQVSAFSIDAARRTAQAEALQQALQTAESQLLERVELHAQRERELMESMVSRERDVALQVNLLQKELQDREADWMSRSNVLRNELLSLRQQHDAAMAGRQRDLERASQQQLDWQMAYALQRERVIATAGRFPWRLSPALGALANAAQLPVPHAALTALSPSSLSYPMANSLSSASSPNRGSLSTLGELLSLHDESFVRAAYRLVLLREADDSGLAFYLNRIRAGVGKLEILKQLRASQEGQKQAEVLTGLDDAIANYMANKRSFWRFIGRRDRNAEERLHVLESRMLQLADTQNGLSHLESHLHRLNEDVPRLAQTVAIATAIARFNFPDLDSWRCAERISTVDGEEFLEFLFSIALGRGAQEHESRHYLHLLDTNTSKLHIVNILLSSEESRSRRGGVSGDPVSLPTFSDPPPSNAPSVGREPSSHDEVPLDFPIHDVPLVSVIIPVYGKVDFTMACLRSIHRHLPRIPFEVIVVDDLSPDDTRLILSAVPGIKVVLNAQNMGFIRSCNAGAARAVGRYVCFLNNDTEVTPGWLDELAATFELFPHAGLVGSKLIYPDGSLQEAGGIIWRDGSAWNYGRHQDPSLPHFNYAREVDYCSGASIMLERALFDELNGFDEHYVPAYCEDSDLALKVRSRGLRVIYQPQSVVVHYEGVTSGTDVSSGVKSYQVENARKLYARWSEYLSAHQENGMDVDRAKDRRARRRVLVLDHCTPTPDQDAGSVTVLNLLLLLREMDFQITFIPEDNFLYMPDYTTALQRLGIEVLYAPYVTSVRQHLEECRDRYDLAFLFRPGVMERHLQAVRQYLPGAKVLYHTVDLHFLRMSREARLEGSSSKQEEADAMKVREMNVINAADASIVHSTAEFDILRADLPQAQLHVFPLIMNPVGATTPFAERRDVVFIGGYQHTPNVDAVRFFVAEVMPLLRTQIPGIRFFAVGSKPPPDIQTLASDDVIVTGYVDDLNSLLAKMRVSVAPLRFGAGIKGKIGSAMVVGLPVVATTLAVEGMSLSDGENVIVADTADHIASAVTSLYGDEKLWLEISESGLRFADESWGATAAWKRLAGILADMSLDVGTRDSRYPLILYSFEKMSLSANRLEKKV